MSVLLLRLAGPMQSWGTQSRFSIRDTGMEPSKSGVIGLVCAALGKPRQERPGDGFPTLAELALLRMGVRVDREGLMKQDYHTAGGTHRAGEEYGVRRSDGKPGGTVLSRRYYLADATFLVGLEGDHGLLEGLARALRSPVWPLALGRKSLTPSVPVALPEAPPEGPALRQGELGEVLRGYPWLSRWGLGRQGPPLHLRLVMDSGSRTPEVRRDVPISFVSSDRRFGLRYVQTEFMPLTPDISIQEV